MKAFGDRLPALAGVIGAERARGGDGDEDALLVLGVEQDRVQAHPARARLPFGAGAVTAQAGQLVPVLRAVGRAEDGGVLDSGVDGAGVAERRLEVPDPLELPRPLRAAVVLG